MIAAKLMKGALPIATLLCGLVLGWSLKTAWQPSAASGGGRPVNFSLPALEPAPGQAIEESLDLAQNVVLTPGQSKEEILKVTRGILRDPNSRRQLRNFLVLLDGLTPENAQTMREVFASWPEKGRGFPRQCQNLFFQRWGELAGEEAFRATTNPIPGETGDYVNMQAAMYGWAQNNLAGALSFAEGLPDQSREREAANWALTETLVLTDLERAAEFVLKLSEPEGGQDWYFAMLAESAEERQRSDLFAEWFEHAPDGPRKGRLALKTLDVLRAKSTDEAVEFLTDVGDAQWRNWDMYWPTAADYAKRDPKAALEWVFSLPQFPNEPAPPGLAAVLEQWHSQQPDAAKTWLLQNTDQPWWPRAARGIMDNFKNSGRGTEAETFLREFTPEAQKMIEQDGMKPKPTIPKPKPEQ